MSIEEISRYYREMLNSLAGLEDDLIANEAPADAQKLLHECLLLCRKDYDERFGRMIGEGLGDGNT